MARDHDLDDKWLIAHGGWDPETAQVLAVAVLPNFAAALIDSNGDGRELSLDQYVRRPGATEWERSISGSADDSGSQWAAGFVMAWGQCEPSQRVPVRWRGEVVHVIGSVAGYWLFAAEDAGVFDPDVDDLPTREVDRSWRTDARRRKR